MKIRIESEPSKLCPQTASPDWIERIRAHHRDFIERHGGPLPDSTEIIAEDRRRET